jgi:hypothetical protein
MFHFDDCEWEPANHNEAAMIDGQVITDAWTRLISDELAS